MSDSIASLRRKMVSVGDLRSVECTMMVLATPTRSVELGLIIGLSRNAPISETASRQGSTLKQQLTAI